MTLELQLTAKEYGHTFRYCYQLYLDYLNGLGADEIKPVEYLEDFYAEDNYYRRNELAAIFNTFIQLLQAECSNGTPYANIMDKLQGIINPVVFDNKLLSKSSQELTSQIISVVNHKDEGLFIIDHLNCMLESLQWFYIDGSVFKIKDVNTITPIEIIQNETGSDIDADDKMPFPDGEAQSKTLPSYERLTLDELLQLELYDFFDYCRHGDGIPDLYLLKYLEKYSDGFKPELVRLIWSDFWPYLEAEKEDFYGNRDRIEAAVERFEKNGIELPLHPDIEYTPPVRKEGKNDEQYGKICEMAKRFHDSQRGTLDVEKLLSTDSLDLWHLFKIESLLKQKMGIPAVEDDTTPIGQRTSNKPCPISRDAVGFLFRELRNKSVIKPIPDTELSESIENLTGYSKEKIRQNNPMSDKAKEDLRGLLHSIAEQLK